MAIGQRQCTTDRSLQLIWDIAEEHRSIFDPLMKAIESGCCVADACIDLIILMRGRGKVQFGWSEEELYILTVEDLMSVLPGKTLSAITMYRIMKMAAPDNENLSVLPPVMVTAWARDPKSPCFVQRIKDYFEFRDTASTTVYILPTRIQESTSLAVCSLTATYCIAVLVRLERTLCGFKKN